MSRKKELLKLKKALLTLGMGSCLVGCSTLDTQQTDNEKINEESSIPKKDKHYVINIGDETIILRDCDDTYSVKDWRYRADYNETYVFIKDENGETPISSFITTNYVKYDGDDPYMLEIEENLIENGARLFKVKK